MQKDFYLTQNHNMVYLTGYSSRQKKGGERMFPTLETERLRLREITLYDREDLFDYLSNEDVIKYYGQEAFVALTQAEALIDFFANNFRENKGVRWGIERKGEQGLIGTVGFHALSVKHRRAEIGYEIHPDYWRKGYASEAVISILQYGFDVLDLTRIGAVVFTKNDASYQLLEKLGFEKEGVLRDYMVQNGIAHDTYVYSLLKNSLPSF